MAAELYELGDVLFVRSVTKVEPHLYRAEVIGGWV
jgi:hypothetical protein